MKPWISPAGIAAPEADIITGSEEENGVYLKHQK
jgi:hypothetical protein